jgi:putative glutathione S-transferase
MMEALICVRFAAYFFRADGVYRAGFATEQKSYEEAVRDVHAALKRCNTILASKRFLLEDKITESDIMLLPTVVRFDAVYASLFKCAARCGFYCIMRYQT